MLKAASELIKMGFHVFPLIENEKTPYLKNFTDLAMTDPDKLKTYWWDSVMEIEHRHNIGIATSKFGREQALVVVDVDNKKGKEGSKTLLQLELEGYDFPKTLTQKTPSGGLHYIYKHSEPLKQGTDVIGSGLDIRSRGGYIVASSSIVGGKAYTFDIKQGTEIADCPAWLVKKLKDDENKERELKKKEPTKKISQKAAASRAKDYLLNNAPVAVEGSGGDSTTFKVANRLKDIGVSEKNALKLMLENWNENCQPPWGQDELKYKIENAYAYGQNSAGIDSPESDFTPIEVDEDDLFDPIEELNKEFAFIVLGGKSTILKQSAKGELEYMGPQAFHDLLKSQTMQTGNGRKKQISQAWFASHKRATYDAIEFSPEKATAKNVYNLWRGFTAEAWPENIEPTAQMREGVELFKEHALKNVCQGDEKLYKWLMGYFAHLVQKPWEKPLVSLVFKGKKGVGKNALVDRIGYLLGQHYLVTANRRFLMGQFNKHLSTSLMFVLDEAFWSGDKQAEGILKDLITGQRHLIEQKGREVYTTQNLLRVCIIGNEEWVVPATEDERRFAVFNVGSERRRDKAFFIKMRRLLEEKDGIRLLMRELLDFDLNSVDINEAPDTQGLIEQKIASLNPIHAWWYSSIKEGMILNLEFTNQDWPETVGRDILRAAFAEYARKRGVKTWLPDAAGFGKELMKCAPKLQNRRIKTGDERARIYLLPSLEESRQGFAQFLGHDLEWDAEDEEYTPLDQVDIFS